MLILSSLVPAVSGTVRLVELAGGAEITPANARFFASPFPVALHVAGSGDADEGVGGHDDARVRNVLDADIARGVHDSGSHE